MLDETTYYFTAFALDSNDSIIDTETGSVTTEFVQERPDIDSFTQTKSKYCGTTRFHAIGVGSDGSEIYIGRDQSNLTEHIATNGDIDNFNTSSQSSISYQSRGLWCKPDGSILYDSHDSGDIYQIDMSTPYSLSGATVSSNNVGVACCGVCLSADGTKLYHGIWANGHEKKFMEYTLAIPRDVSSRGTGIEHTVNAITTSSGDESYIYQIAISPTGKKMYFTADNGNIYQYNLSTAYDWSTATYYGGLNTGIGRRLSFGFREDGQRLYMGTVSQGQLYQYDVS